MTPSPFLRSVAGLIVLVSSAAPIRALDPADGLAVARAQVPAWTAGDVDFFLHGSMSTEVVPEIVLRAFIRTYPDLFPKSL